jgi:hypothetical protein
MPELLMERPKMSLQMHETLKRYILRERRKKKEEDVANEQKIREELVTFFLFFSCSNPNPKRLCSFCDFRTEKGRTKHPHARADQRAGKTAGNQTGRATASN